MKTVKVTLTRKVTYSETFKISDEDFELIKNLDYDDVEAYDFKKGKNIGNGITSVPPNEVYEILEYIDDVRNEIQRDETLYDVTVKEIK